MSAGSKASEDQRGIQTDRGHFIPWTRQPVRANDLRRNGMGCPLSVRMDQKGIGVASKGMDWFPFYWKDFLTSRKVMRLTDEEVGWYVKLLCYQWDEGSIPTDTAEIADMLGADSDAIATAWARLGQCFDERDGTYVNPRMDEVRNEQIERMEKYRKAGRRGAEARWSQDGKANATAMQSQSDRNAIESRVEGEESREEMKEKGRVDQKEKSPPVVPPEGDKQPVAKATVKNSPSALEYDGRPVARSLVDRAKGFKSKTDFVRDTTWAPHQSRMDAWALAHGGKDV